MNSIRESGLFVYEDILAGFPLSLSYGKETRGHLGFLSITSLDISAGAGWSDTAGIIRYFFGGGIKLEMLAFTVRCGSRTAFDFGIQAQAGIDILFTDSLFPECSVKAAYSFLDSTITAMASENSWNTS